jgi:hypothetical protein
MAKGSSSYKKGQAFIFNGEAGWIITQVETKGLVIQRVKPFGEAFVPYDSIKPA